MENTSRKKGPAAGPGPRTCLMCGNPLPSGRKDMKFCGPKCKNRYNYRKHGKFAGVRKRTILYLDKNHRILLLLLSRGVTGMGLMELSGLGFRTDYVTCCRRLRCHTECRCYDIRYFKSDSRIFDIAQVVV